MNRHERRQEARAAAKREAKIQKVNQLYGSDLTSAALAKAAEDGYHRGLRDGEEAGAKTMMAAVCLALHKRYGFGKERCANVVEDAVERFLLAFDSAEEIQAVYDQIGLKLKFSAGEANDLEPVEKIR